MITGITIPGYNNPSSSFWQTGGGLAYPGAIQALGCNWVSIQTSYSSASWTATDVTSTATGSAPGALPDAAITSLVQACRTAGMKIMLKPHCVMADGTTQSLHLPGAQLSVATGSNNNPKNGTCSSGLNTFSSTHFSLVNAADPTGDVGKRVVTPTAPTAGGIPNSGYADTYARPPAPTYTTVATVTSSTAGTMSANALASFSTGLIAVLADDNGSSAAATWFSNWQATLLHLLSVAQAADPTGVGADLIDIGTEKDWLFRYYPSSWSSLISTIRADYPHTQITAQVGEGLTYYADLGFAGSLDYIGISCYPTVGSAAGGDPQYVPVNNWRTTVAPLDGWASAWNVPYLFAEIGARSIVGACYQPYQTTGGTVQSPAVDQASFVAGFFPVMVNDPWFAGWMWWTWAGPLGVGGDNGGYCPQAPAQAAMTSWLSTPGVAFPRRITTGHQRRIA